MQIKDQTLHELQYLTMQLIGYNKSPKYPELLALYHVMEYLMHHKENESIIY